MLELIPLKWVVYSFAAICGIIIAETFYLLFASKSDKRASINRRMKLKNNQLTQRDVLIQLQKERGMDEGKKSIISMQKLKLLKNPIWFAHALGAVHYILHYLCHNNWSYYFIQIRAALSSICRTNCRRYTFAYLAIEP